MRKLTTFLFLFLLAFALQGQTVLTHDGKILRAYDANQPLNISTTCEVWLDGKDASTFTLDGTSVDDWTGKGSLGITVSNPNPDATRPTYDSNTGRVTFTASNNTFLQSADFGGALTQPNTVFVVYKITGALDETEAIFDSDDVTKQSVLYYATSTFRIYNTNPLIDGATNTNDNIHVALFNGDVSEYWINGISVASGNTGEYPYNGITLGVNASTIAQNADCEIMEVIVYNDSISYRDRDVLTAYLANKWEITATTDFKGYILYTHWYESYFKDGEAFDNGKVVIQFDDGWGSEYDNGLSIFQAKEIKASIFINANKVGGVDSGSGFDFLTWAEIVEMHEAGIDMQCHGNMPVVLENATDEQIIAEYIDNNTAFIDHGLPIPYQTVFAGGSFNDHALDILDDYRKTGRTVFPGYTNRKSNKYVLLAPNIQTDIAILKGMMDVAKADKTALILWGHMIGVENVMSISVADLEELIDYGKLIGLDFITTSELYNLMFYIDIRLSRDCADNQINVICKNKLYSQDYISIERSDDDGENYSEIHVLNPGETDYSDTDLTLNKNYYYRARGFKGGHYLPYSREASTSTAISLTLTSTGDGSGVSMFRIDCIEPVTLTLDGTARFYTDAGGSVGESSTVTIRGLTSTYIRCPSGTATLKISKNIIYKIEAWNSADNAANLSGDITKLAKLEYLYITGNNTLSGDISKLKLLTYIRLDDLNIISGSVEELTLLTNLYVRGNNTLSGDISQLEELITIKVVGDNTLSGSIENLTSLIILYIEGNNTVSGNIENLTSSTYIRVQGSNTLSGSIADLTLLTYIQVKGNNTISGNLEGLTSLTTIIVSGNNTISGDLSVISSTLTYVMLANTCAIVDYTAGGDWSSITASGYIDIRPSVGYGLSSAEVDLFLQEISATKVEGRAITVVFLGSNAARTSDSDAAVADIITDGGSVITN